MPPSSTARILLLDFPTSRDVGYKYSTVFDGWLDMMIWFLVGSADAIFVAHGANRGKGHPTIPSRRRRRQSRLREILTRLRRASLLRSSVLLEYSSVAQRFRLLYQHESTRFTFVFFVPFCSNFSRPASMADKSRFAGSVLSNDRFRHRSGRNRKEPLRDRRPDG